MKIIKTVSVLLLSFAFVSCTEAQDVSSKKGQVEIESNFAKDVSVEEFQKLIAQEGALVDVRTPGEYAQGHLENATNINIFASSFNEQVSKLDKNKPVYLYCKSGGRSAKAMSQLKGLGFTKLYNMVGGYSGWSARGLPTTK